MASVEESLDIKPRIVGRQFAGDRLHTVKPNILRQIM
jgi:hypothetical protein